MEAESRSPLWNQIKADILQRPVCVTSSKEAACLGAAMLAGKAAGIFDNIEEASASMVKITARYEPDPRKKMYMTMATRYIRSSRGLPGSL